jgi:hypothetical protein
MLQLILQSLCASGWQLANFSLPPSMFSHIVTNHNTAMIQKNQLKNQKESSQLSSHWCFVELILSTVKM